MLRIIACLLLIVLSFGYLAPAAIAAMRNTDNKEAVCVVNLFLGWTIVGWFIAAAMAMKSTKPLRVIVVTK